MSIAYSGLQGNIWIGTHNGIIRFDGIHTTIFEGFTSKDSIHCKFLVNVSQKDAEGNLWFAHTTGITKVNPLNLKMEHFELPSGSMAINKKGQILCTNENGLCIFQKNGTK